MLIYAFICILFATHVIILYVLSCYVIYLLPLLFTEFCSNGNWECSVPVHPGLSLDKSQPHVEKQHLHTTGRVLRSFNNDLCTYVRTYVCITQVSTLQQKSLLL